MQLHRNSSRNFSVIWRGVITQMRWRHLSFVWWWVWMLRRQMWQCAHIPCWLLQDLRVNSRFCCKFHAGLSRFACESHLEMPEFPRFCCGLHVATQHGLGFSSESFSCESHLKMLDFAGFSCEIHATCRHRLDWHTTHYKKVAMFLCNGLHVQFEDTCWIW